MRWQRRGRSLISRLAEEVFLGGFYSGSPGIVAQRWLSPHGGSKLCKTRDLTKSKGLWKHSEHTPGCIYVNDQLGHRVSFIPVMFGLVFYVLWPLGYSLDNSLLLNHVLYPWIYVVKNDFSQNNHQECSLFFMLEVLLCGAVSTYSICKTFIMGEHKNWLLCSKGHKWKNIIKRIGKIITAASACKEQKGKTLLL